MLLELLKLCMYSIGQISADGHSATVFKLILGSHTASHWSKCLVVMYNNHISLAGCTASYFKLMLIFVILRL